ncbi:MAG: flagellar export chaperone FliS [Anaerofustis sp.]
MYNQLTQYKEQAISTMSKGELIIALFDEALKNIRHGILLMNQEDYAVSKKCTEKTKSIFNYLCVALNRNYDVSNNLYKLYTFFNQEIIKAEVRRDPTVLEGILPLVTDMRETWVQAEKLIHMK